MLLLKVTANRPAININFKKMSKDKSKEIPKSLLFNMKKYLIKIHLSSINVMQYFA